MPHLRERYLQSHLQRMMKASSIIGIMGQRQSGKTTLLSNLAEEYVTLDSPREREIAQSAPESWLENRSTPFGIDECQLVPELFPALKESVRKKPARGRFILSGSVRFTSRKAIRESLTGRIVNLELLPLGLAESHELPQLFRLTQFLRKPTAWIHRESSLKTTDLAHYLVTGGLPGICFQRSSYLRTQKFESQLETLLERDIRLVLPTTLAYRQIRSFLAWIAQRQGQPLTLAEATRQTQISPRTLNRLLQAFEALFLIRVFDSQGGTSTPIAYLEDQGMATYLMNQDKADFSQLADLTRALYMLSYHAFHYADAPGFRFYAYQTRGGARVPLCFHTPQGTLGIIPCVGSQPTFSSLKSAQSFTKSHSKGSVLIVCSEGEEHRTWHPKVHSVPLASFLHL